MKPGNLNTLTSAIRATVTKLIENTALKRAIKEGKNTRRISRETVLATLAGR